LTQRINGDRKSTFKFTSDIVCKPPSSDVSALKLSKFDDDVKAIWISNNLESYGNENNLLGGFMQETTSFVLGTFPIFTASLIRALSLRYCKQEKHEIARSGIRTP